MRITQTVAGLKEMPGAIEGLIAAATTAGMREATIGLRDELRDQIRNAGLGSRLANTWRGEAYPKSGRSLEPAGYVYSKAPTIIGFFASGGVITPIGGHPYLAIPTKDVPQSRGSRGARRRMTPFEVEQAFNQDLIIRQGKGSNLLGFIDAIPAKNKRGWRQRTKGRVAQGRQSKLVLMFTFVRRVVGRKRLDLAGPAQRWGAAVPGLVAKHWTA